MLSRMNTTTLVARSIRVAVARRALATAKSPSGPPAGSKTAHGVPKTSPPSSPATPVQPSTKAPQSLNSASLLSRASNAHFAKARVNLPLRFYNKPGTLASRLYVEAEKKGKAEVDNVAKSLTSLKNELQAHPKLLAFFLNAAKTPQQKSKLIASLSSSLKFSPTLSTFLDYMATTRTTKEINKVIQSYENLVNARDKVVNVTITVAAPDQPKPDSKEIAKVLKYPQDTNIKLKTVIDPAIEGGAILSSKDRYLDRSFRRATSVFREKLELEAAKKKAQKRTEFLKELAQFPDSVHP
eukprot:Phypoly_transcript_13613.p1 GENE.Phypoly_transcript_13613~~Phypoly_transcript_13613.p1  ORF type:complete len:297 (+),score=80.18 Phypoly_transcript_13613:48-938(+)